MTADLICQRCDECGRQIARAHSVDGGRRYCATCYPRIFKRRLCPKCGNLARLPKSNPAALCRKCEIDKPCIRCGKISYSIGKITIYGPVCNACAPHFRKPEPCEVCGALSPKLTRVSRLGHDRRVCPKCARSDHRTCQACNRYRALQEAPDGRMLCKSCLDKGETLCPKCRAVMPAGYGHQCQRCYWRGLLEKRIRMDCAALSSSAMTAHFDAFANWLHTEVGENKAARTVHRYLPFFMEIERQWNGLPEYSVLLAHFGTAKLRRVLLPMRWMEETGLVVPNQAEKANDSDRRRIAAALGKFAKGSKEQTLLEGYYNALIEDLKAGKTTLHSIRLALSPAAALLHKAGEMSRMPPVQCTLDTYLTKTPGQRAAISGFVRYLRDAHGVEIALPKVDPDRARQQRRKELKAELLALMREGGDSDEFKQRWLSIALAYFHGLDKSIGLAVGDTHLLQADGGLAIALNNLIYWLPAPPG